MPVLVPVRPVRLSCHWVTQERTRMFEKYVWKKGKKNAANYERKTSQTASPNLSVTHHCFNHNSCNKSRRKMTIQNSNVVIFPSQRRGTKQEIQQFIQYHREFEWRFVLTSDGPDRDPPQPRAKLRILCPTCGCGRTQDSFAAFTPF